MLRFADPELTAGSKQHGFVRLKIKYMKTRNTMMLKPASLFLILALQFTLLQI